MHSDPGPPGFFEQFGRTRAAFRRLLGTHFALLRAELSEIFAELRVLGAQAGIALGLALLLLNMLYIGGFLFLGEWLFGSIGWGLAHGALLLVALIVLLAMLMLGAGRGAVGGALAGAVVLAVIVGLLLALNVINDTATYFSQQLAAPLDNPQLVGALGGAVIVGLLLLIVGARAAGGSGAIAGLVGGALLGALLGFVFALRWDLAPAVAFAITVALIAWPILLVALAWPKLDPAARFARLKPTTTIDTANETKAWLENQWRSRQKKLAKR